jgi:hypothetical protein
VTPGKSPLGQDFRHEDNSDDLEYLRSFINHEFLTSEGVRTWSVDELNAALDRIEARLREAGGLRD